MGTTIKPKTTTPEAKWHKKVTNAVKTQGVWGPSLDKATVVKPSQLPAKLKPVYDKMKKENIDGFTPRVEKLVVDGKPAYIFEDQFDGFTAYSIRDAAGHHIPLGRDRKFEAEEKKRADAEWERTRPRSANPTVDAWKKLTQVDEEGPYLTPAASWATKIRNPAAQLGAEGAKIWKQWDGAESWKNPKDGSILLRNYTSQTGFEFADIGADKKLLEKFRL